MEEENELFSHPEELPKEVQEIIKSFDEDGGEYKECTRLENKLRPNGYEFEWYLDGIPYNLLKITI